MLIKNKEVRYKVLENVRTYIEMMKLSKSVIKTKLDLTDEEYKKYLNGNNKVNIHWFAQSLALELDKDKMFFYRANVLNDSEELIYGLTETAFEFNYDEHLKKNVRKFIRLMDTYLK